MARKSKYRAAFKARKGGLHQWARNQGWSGKDSEPLPEKYKHMAAGSDNEHTRKMGQFALNFGGRK